MMQEIQNTLSAMLFTYKALGFKKLELLLSTRPDHYVGTVEEWDEAESVLESVLVQLSQPTVTPTSPSATPKIIQSQSSSAPANTKSPFIHSTNDISVEWNVNEKDGAFYGPKIDLVVETNRKHQLATLQLDFQLPVRFNLSYDEKHNSLQQRPVLIHRALLGSFERVMGVLCEWYDGKWPLWISPRQVVIIDASGACGKYAAWVAKRIRTPFSEDVADVPFDQSFEESRFTYSSKTDLSLHVDINTSSDTMSKKIRDAFHIGYNFIAVVGPREEKNGTVSIRSRGSSTSELLSLHHFRQKLQKLVDSFQ